MPRIVPPIGPRDQPLLALVGEAPGREEDLQGRPFVGPSGHLLDQLLSKAGVSRGDCYITNIALERPPNNDFRARYYEDRQGKRPTVELLDCRERVWREIKEVNPKMVVLLGAEPLKTFTHEDSIKNFRGTVVEKFGHRFLPTYHPAYVLRMYGERPVVEADLKKAVRQARFPHRPPTNFETSPTHDNIIEVLRRRPEKLAVDIETIGHKIGKPHIRTIGLAWNKYDALCIPFIRGGTHAWTEDQEGQILWELQKLFASPYVKFILQNHPFDCTVLEREFGLSINNVYLDTMFAHHTLHPELPKGLDFLSSIYTDHPMYWGSPHESDEALAKYNCLDCVVTFEVAEAIEQELRERNLWDFYQTEINPAVRALTRAQNRGVLIDQDLRAVVEKQTEDEMDRLLSLIHTESHPGFNPRSPKQVLELISAWGLSPPRNPKTKKPTTDDESLQALSRKHPERAEVLQAIVEYRQKGVLLSTFVKMPLNQGRVHTSYNLAGTVTGRIASSRTFDGYGGNLTNIPRGQFRSMFRADPGKVLIKSDLSQAEYRVLIWRARILRVIQRWVEDPKWSIHMWNAAENIYRVPYEKITKDMYSKAKNGVYGANYGIGAQKVSKMYNIPFQEAKFIIERYHEAVHEVKGVYQQEIRQLVQSTRTITNPLGRERVFLGRMDDDLYRAAYSHYCQSTVADIIHKAIISLDDQGLDCLLQVHDELVVQCPESEVDTYARVVRDAMEQELWFEGVEVPLVIPAEVKVGPNWHETEEYRFA